MFNLGKVSLTFGLVLLLAQAAPAQAPPRIPGGGGGFGGGPVGLLQNEGVQKELKLNDDQIKKIQDVGKDIREKHKDDFAKLRDLDQSERQEKMQAMMKTVKEESTKALAGVLTPDQEKRLKQLTLQAQGSMALADPEVQTALKLTDDQKEAIKTIGADAMKEMQEIRQNAGGDREAARTKFQALQKETKEKIDGVLTADQKKAWKDMTGEAFKLERGPRPGA